LLPVERSIWENADLLGLANANGEVVFSSAFVVNGSPTQTAMADHAGAGSLISQIAPAHCSSWPRCFLRAIVFTIGIGMIDVGPLRATRLESSGKFQLAPRPVRWPVMPRPPLHGSSRRIAAN